MAMAVEAAAAAAVGDGAEAETLPVAVVVMDPLMAMVFQEPPTSIRIIPLPLTLLTMVRLAKPYVYYILTIDN